MPRCWKLERAPIKLTAMISNAATGRNIQRITAKFLTA